MEIKALHSDSVIDRETVAALSPRSTFALPAITAGRMALLDLIDSPLLRGGRMTSRDLWIAVWVISVGPNAVAAINKAVRGQEAIERAKELATRDADSLREYLGALRASADDMAAVDIAVAKFAESTGIMPVDMAQRLSEAMVAAMAGFGMVESVPGDTGSDKKKRIGVTPSGWQGWGVWLLSACRRFAGMLGFGICRLL